MPMHLIIWRVSTELRPPDLSAKYVKSKPPAHCFWSNLILLYAVIAM